jgi:small neutral amino acid transporter SnatA (MarC family)
MVKLLDAMTQGIRPDGLDPEESSVARAVSAKLSSFLGEKGITAIERLMGMVLVASAVQMFLDGATKVMRQ